MDFKTAEESIKNQIDILKNGEFSERELQKVKNRVQSALLFTRLGVLNIAMELAFFEHIGKAEMINELENKYNEVSVDKVVSVANKIFKDDNLSCIYYESNKSHD